jgi:hypothetical protein
MAKKMFALSDEASRALKKLANESGMSADELLTMAVFDLVDSGKVLEKSEHDKLAAAVRDALGEHADEYDADAIARAIGHSGALFALDAIRYGILFNTDNFGERYLLIGNLTIDLDCFEV